MAISPRLATSTFENMARGYPRLNTAAAAVLRVGRRSGRRERAGQASGASQSNTELGDEPGYRVAASAVPAASGTSSTVTDCWPPAIVATSVVSPARRWNQVARRSSSR